jgi:hypothetical protein
VGDPPREHARLPRTGARQDAQRRRAAGDGGSLLPIEALEESRGIHRDDVNQGV